MSGKRLEEVTVGKVEKLDGQISLSPYDGDWPIQFIEHRTKKVNALGGSALLIEHVGSTSVPGLSAKPIIDIVLEVEDASQETAYVPALAEQGYVLKIREPNWFEHRMFKFDSPDVNLHVFSRACAETKRMVNFRDHLRSHPPDLALYESTKRDLARRRWEFVQDYADAKSQVIETILNRASSAIR